MAYCAMSMARDRGDFSSPGSRRLPPETVGEGTTNGATFSSYTATG